MHEDYDKETINNAQKNILYISPNINSDAKGGREQLSSLNFKALADLYGSQFSFHNLKKNKSASFISKASKIFGYLDGLTKKNTNEILDKIKEKKIQQVFINGSNLGKLAKAIKQRFPSVQIISFFHNVETKFFFDSFKRALTIKSFFILVSNYLTEFKAVKYSDVIICLSDRDSNALFALFKRKADHLAPMVMEDQVSYLDLEEIPDNNFALFVGGAFFANISGITWFINNVMPFIDDDLYVIGKGFEPLAAQFSDNKKVHVIGYVENLDPWYQGAKYSIAPIFEGSGMKTKVAESLMYGVPIIGTSEAFSGYEEVNEVAGKVCNSANEFIETIINFKILTSSKQRRDIFEKTYSYNAGKSRLRLILRS